MNINYTVLDDLKKSLYFTHGFYEIETEGDSRWIWTSNVFGGVAVDVNYVCLTFKSQVENVLLLDKESVIVKPGCLNVLKFKFKNKKNFEFKLKSPFTPPNDNRSLGVQIMKIVIDDDVIF